VAEDKMLLAAAVIAAASYLLDQSKNDRVSSVSASVGITSDSK